MADEYARDLLNELISNVVLSGSVSRLEPPAETGSVGVAQENAAEQTGQLARQLAELTRVTLAQTDSVSANTQAVIENSLTSASGGGSKAASVGKTLLSFLGGGFGLVQLVGKLFDGGDEQPASVAERYSLPAPVSIEAASGLGTGIQPLRYASDGLPRSVPASAPATNQPVTIQVQAMDSRSFMDHSAEIAQAVREALLHSHSLSAVVTEL